MAKTSIACIAISGKKVLVAHRNPTGQMGGRWEFPGGKVEPGETDQAAIIREMDEEFGIQVVPGELIAQASFFHNDEEVALHCYRMFVPHDGIQSAYRLTEHSEYRWADVSEIPGLPFVDSDRALYEAVKAYVERSTE
ncbi:MAG: NUDIX domain-containing protein [Treponema sp.]|nr:NUDIX domain-containing protein [Treponema sp.]